MLPKNQLSFVQKKSNFWQSPDRVVTLGARNYIRMYLIPCLMLPFSEATALRFSSK